MANKILKAEFGTPDKPLIIGEVEIPCYVLENGQRVLSRTGMIKSLGMATGSTRGGDDRLTSFVAQPRFNDLISNDIRAMIASPIKFKLSGNIIFGYDATILVDICDVIIQARNEGRLQKQQEHLADNAELLIRGFAKTGIIALVDEATGYQEVRDRKALHKILEMYISPTLLPWTKRFPDEFYKEMFRLNGWTYNPQSVKRPGVIGKWTNQLIYDQLPNGVLEELKEKTPKNVHLHRNLTPDIGHPHLSNQLASVTAIMRLSSNWKQFLSNFAKSFRTGGQAELDLEE